MHQRDGGKLIPSSLQFPFEDWKQSNFPDHSRPDGEYLPISPTKKLFPHPASFSKYPRVDRSQHACNQPNRTTALFVPQDRFVYLSLNGVV